MARCSEMDGAFLTPAHLSGPTDLTFCAARKETGHMRLLDVLGGTIGCRGESRGGSGGGGGSEHHRGRERERARRLDRGVARCICISVTPCHTVFKGMVSVTSPSFL